MEIGKWKIKMNRPAFEVIVEDTQKTAENHILILDKEGTIGEALCEKLKNESLVIFVSYKAPGFLKEKSEDYKNIVFIPYKVSIPQIPDGKYSHVFINYNGEKEIEDAIPVFIQNAENSKARFILICSLLKRNRKIIDKAIEGYKNSCAVVYGDIFGGGDLEDSEALAVGKINEGSVINKFLYQAKSKGRVIVSGAGLEKTYPVFFEDAISGILETAFGANLLSSTYLLFPKYAPTQLSLAHSLHKIDPLLRIDFIKETEEGMETKIYEIPDGKYILGESYDFHKRIKEVFESFEIHKKDEENKEAYIPEILYESKNKNNKFQYLFFAILFLFLTLLFPILMTAISSYFALSNLKEVKMQIEKGEPTNALKAAKLSNLLFNISRKTFKLTAFELTLIGKKDLADNLEKNIETGKEISAIAVDLVNAYKNLFNVFDGKSLNSREDFINGTISLKKSLVFFQKAKAEELAFLKKGGFNFENLDKSVGYFANTLDVMPILFGIEKEKKYLVLFQNNMELRPGGGFIGSYGILTMNNGRVKDFVIHDVYAADGQLKGHIEPPFPIRRYIPLVHLFLRDSNFDVDFSKNASVAAYMLQQETGEVVDGVIGIDVTFVKNLLKEIGPTFVSDYNETVTADNLYMLTQTHAEKDFFPGSNQKRNFLRSLFNSIKMNITAKKNLSYVAVLNSLGKSISEKHLLFAFSDSSIQSLFTINNMSSSIWDLRTFDGSKINDFLGINEANIGVNKANYFIKRKISQSVNIKDNGVISEKLIVTYKNLSKKNEWPGGDYKAYFRIVLPKNTKLNSIKIGDKDQNIVKAVTDPLIYEGKFFKAPNGLEVEKTEIDGKTIYGFIFTVSVQELKSLVLTYDLPFAVSISNQTINYDQRVFKQPGTEEDVYQFSLNYPENLNIVNAVNNADYTPKYKKEKLNISFSTVLNKDLNINLEFAKK